MAFSYERGTPVADLEWTCRQQTPKRFISGIVRVPELQLLVQNRLVCEAFVDNRPCSAVLVDDRPDCRALVDNRRECTALPPRLPTENNERGG